MRSASCMLLIPIVAGLSTSPTSMRVGLHLRETSLEQLVADAMVDPGHAGVSLNT